MKIVERAYAEPTATRWSPRGVHPVLARVYAGRRIRIGGRARLRAGGLLAPQPAEGRRAGARASSPTRSRAKKRLLIVADYDADGATACAVGLRALRAFGAEVDYLVPDRFKLGYGLSPELVELAAQRKPDLLITVDNGIASVEGVARANALGIATLITDHHLPGAELPAAACIVNPNQPGCGFPVQGAGRCRRDVLRDAGPASRTARRGSFQDKNEPNLGALTDLVALGTIADVVPLDANNRNLVVAGPEAPARRARPAGHRGAAARRRDADPAEASSFDLGFVAGPRLNAAGRLADMSLGIECLITDDEARAANCAQQLDRLNRERRKIEAGMLRAGAAGT